MGKSVQLLKQLPDVDKLCLTDCKIKEIIIQHISLSLAWAGGSLHPGRSFLELHPQIVKWMVLVKLPIRTSLLLPAAQASLRLSAFASTAASPFPSLIMSPGCWISKKNQSLYFGGQRLLVWWTDQTTSCWSYPTSAQSYLIFCNHVNHDFFVTVGAHRIGCFLSYSCLCVSNLQCVSLWTDYRLSAVFLLVLASFTIKFKSIKVSTCVNKCLQHL